MNKPMSEGKSATSLPTGDRAEWGSSVSKETEDRIHMARERIEDVLQKSKEVYGQVREKTVAGVKMADNAVHDKPYQAILIAIGLGAILGSMLTKRCQEKIL